MASIFERLNFKNIGLGRVQSVDEMTVVPLVGPDRGNIASPESLNFQSTTQYGTMVFENTDPINPAIVPANIMERKMGGQDHAMAGSGIVKNRSSQSFNNACCIEESQGGYLRGKGDEDILPIALRKTLLNIEKRRKGDYTKLWPDIKRWLRGVVTSSRAHLRYFYDSEHFKEKLEQFAAEFEPVENQIGAVILFAGVPVGIEIMPTAEHWEAYWQQLVRGCYGAEMLRLKKLGKLKPSALILPEIPEDADADEVEKILTNFSEKIQKDVIPLLDNITPSGSNVIQQTDNLKTVLLSTGSGGGGDMIQQDATPIYLSLVL